MDNHTKHSRYSIITLAATALLLNTNYTKTFNKASTKNEQELTRLSKIQAETIACINSSTDRTGQNIVLAITGGSGIDLLKIE